MLLDVAAWDGEEDVMDVCGYRRLILITSSNVQTKENRPQPIPRDMRLGITILDTKVWNYEFRFSQHLYQRYNVRLVKKYNWF
jgi:hypothetical protein